MKILTKEKLDKAIDSLDQSLELDIKLRKTKTELRNTLLRQKFALIPNIKQMILELEQRTRKEVEKELEDQDERQSFLKWKVISRSRQRIMRESIYSRYMPERDGLFPRWDDFLFFAQQIWEKDRANLIKEGKIKIE